MATITILDEIAAALTELGVLAEGETPSAIAARDGLRAINRMLDQWSAESLIFYIIQRTPWTITSGTPTYTVGLLGTIIAPRPVSADAISQINISDSSTSPAMETPLQMLTEAEYAAIPQKTLTSALPYAWYYNPLLPTGQISLYPTPTSTTLQGVMYAPKATAQFANLDDPVAMPPGYEEMLITNLAVNLASSYRAQISPDLRERAIEAKAIVKRSNSKIVDMAFPAIIGGGGRYSIYTDGPL